MAKKNGRDDVIIIKKYANRRLYDTSSSAYITLDHLSDLVRKGVDFEVRDAKTGEDLTRAVLTQIIFEQETKGQGALPTNFLRQLIRFYGDNMQGVLPAWLDMSMNSFAERQENWRSTLGKAMPRTPFDLIEEQTRRNMAIFERAMSAFTPPTPKPRTDDEIDAGADAYENDDDEDDVALDEDAIAIMQAQMADIQAQLAALSKKSGK